MSAFAIDPKTGDLALLNQQPSEGGGPCHLVVDEAASTCSSPTTGAAPWPSCRSERTGGSRRPRRSGARGLGAEQGPAGEAARPRHLPQRGRALRLLARPRRRPRLRLPLRRREGHARAARRGHASAGLGTAAPRLRPEGEARVRDQRAPLDDHRPARYDAAKGELTPDETMSHAARRVHRHELDGRGRGLAGRPVRLRLEPRPRQPRRLRRGTSRPAGSRRRPTCRPAGRRRATSPSTRPGTSCSPPTRAPTRSRSSASDATTGLLSPVGATIAVGKPVCLLPVRR